MIREVVRANTIMLQIKQQAGELKEKAAVTAEFKQSLGWVLLYNSLN